MKICDVCRLHPAGKPGPGKTYGVQFDLVPFGGDTPYQSSDLLARSFAWDGDLCDEHATALKAKINDAVAAVFAGANMASGSP